MSNGWVREKHPNTKILEPWDETQHYLPILASKKKVVIFLLGFSTRYISEGYIYIYICNLITPINGLKNKYLGFSRLILFHPTLRPSQVPPASAKRCLAPWGSEGFLEAADSGKHQHPPGFCPNTGNSGVEPNCRNLEGVKGGEVPPEPAGAGGDGVHDLGWVGFFVS